MTPQLWGEDLPAVVRWIKEILANSTRANLSALGLSDSEGTGTSAVSSESAGMTRVWLGPEVPAGWLLLDGTYVFINQYPDLYDAIGNAGGVETPPGMFKLPVAPTALDSGMWIVKW